MATLNVVGRRYAVVDWRGLRRALGLTHRQMSEVLCIHERNVYQLEAGTYAAPSRASMMLLRAWLQHPEFRQRLQATGYPHPFPEDLADGVDEMPT